MLTQEERRMTTLTATLAQRGVLPAFYRTPRRQRRQAQRLQRVDHTPAGGHRLDPIGAAGRGRHQSGERGAGERRVVAGHRTGDRTVAGSVPGRLRRRPPGMGLDGRLPEFWTAPAFRYRGRWSNPVPSRCCETCRSAPVNG